MEKPKLDVDSTLDMIEEINKEEPNKEEPKKVVKKTTKVKSEEISTERTWKSVFIANYEGTSQEAKSLKEFTKETYKGDVYIPWAVMERLVYMCDENAKFTVITNTHGGLVHTDMNINRQSQINKEAEISSEAMMFSHFIKVALEFMGKVFIEDYPIQEQDYSAARIYNQNLVNRAIQRAKAKVGARASGLGLKLYEGIDLQFDKIEEPVKKPELLNVEPVKEEPVKVEVKPEPVKEEVVQEVVQEAVQEAVQEVKPEIVQEVKPEVVQESVMQNDVEITAEIAEVISVMRNADATNLVGALQRINIPIMKKYNFALSPNDTDEELAIKFSNFPNVPQFKKTLENLLSK